MLRLTPTTPTLPCGPSRIAQRALLVRPRFTMNLNLPSNLIGAVVGIAYVWFLVAAIMDCFTSRRSDLSKINWITFVLVVPFLGLLAFFIFGGTRAKKRGIDSPVYIEGDAALPRR
jgi:ABC-type amino acid transport system permease subunit